MSTQELQGAQVLWLQNKPKSSPIQHKAWQLLRGVCAEVMRLVFTKHAAVHYDQTFPLVSSVQHCSRSHVVCTDATFSNCTVT